MTSGSSISTLEIQQEGTSQFNFIPASRFALSRTCFLNFKIVILILVCVKIIQAATLPQFLPFNMTSMFNLLPWGRICVNVIILEGPRRVVKERSCKEERCRHFDCSHGLSSVCSPRLSHHSACIWFFNDSIWYCKHYRCTSLVFLRWFWNMGRHLGKESKLYSL